MKKLYEIYENDKEYVARKCSDDTFEVSGYSPVNAIARLIILIAKEEKDERTGGL